MGQFDSVIVCVDKLAISSKLKGRLCDKNKMVHFQTKDLEIGGYLFEITDDGHLTVTFLEQCVTLDKLSKTFRMYTTIGGSTFPASEWPKQDFKWIEFIVTFEYGKLKGIIFDQDLYDNGKKY